jgi:hypothetical protein
MTWEEIQPGLTAGKVATLDDRILIFKQIPCTVEGHNIDFLLQNLCTNICIFGFKYKIGLYFLYLL